MNVIHAKGQRLLDEARMVVNQDFEDKDLRLAAAGFVAGLQRAMDLPLDGENRPKDETSFGTAYHLRHAIQLYINRMIETNDEFSGGK